MSDELNTILNTAGIGITRCSRDLRCLRANETYATIAGLPLGKIIINLQLRYRVYKRVEAALALRAVVQNFCQESRDQLTGQRMQ